MDGSSFRSSISSETPLRPDAAVAARLPRQVTKTASTPWEKKKAQISELKRLSEISKSLSKLHRDEAALLRERDMLVAHLRKQEVSWSSLATRTGLSRQALSKRMASSTGAV